MTDFIYSQKEKDILNHYLLPQEERLKLGKSSLFAEMHKYWHNGRYNHRKNIGCLSYIWKEAHDYYNPKNKLISFEDFENYYFRSGKCRYNDNERHNGRTVSELYEITLNFKYYLCKYSLNVDTKTLFNFVYTNVIDKGYIGYIAEMKIMETLIDSFKNVDFKFNSKEYDIDYMVDILVYKDDKPVLGIAARPASFLSTGNSYIENIKNIDSVGHCRFRQDFNIDTIYIYFDKIDDMKIKNIGELSEKINKVIDLKS